MNDQKRLWLLRPRDDLDDTDNPWEPWYDRVFGFVVRAGSEGEARRLAHEQAGDEINMWSGHAMAWLETRYSTCTELTREGPSEVILREIHMA